MTVQEYWTDVLTYRGRVRILTRTGHAEGLAGMDWDEMPFAVRHDIEKLFEQKASNAGRESNA